MNGIIKSNLFGIIISAFLFIASYSYGQQFPLLEKISLRYFNSEGTEYKGYLLNNKVYYISKDSIQKENKWNYDTLIFNYYDLKDKERLYKKLILEKKLDSAFVGFEINLSDSLFGNDTVISGLHFNDCVLLGIVTNSESKRRLHIEDGIKLNNVTIFGISLNNFFINGDIIINNCHKINLLNMSNFKCSGGIIVNNTKSINFFLNKGEVQTKSIFEALLIESFTLIDITFEDTLILIINNSIPKSSQLNFSSIHYIKNLMINRYFKYKGLVYEPYIHRITINGNFEFIPENENYFDTVAIERRKLISSQFLFPKRINMLISNQNSLIDMGFNPTQIQSMLLLYKVPLYQHDNYHDIVCSSFKSEIVKVENNTNWLYSDRENVIQWFNYQIDEERYNYLKYKNNTSALEWFEFLWLSITQKVVNHGYKGLTPFTLWTLGFIFLFTGIYYSSYRYTITHYINTGEISLFEVKNPSIKTNRGLDAFIQKSLIRFGDIFRCAWFSFVILVNPRWPVKYFKFSPGLLFVIFLEWFIGLFLLFLFVVYILSRYSFVKAFLAL